MAKKKLIHDPRSPQLFSNEQLGLPPDDYEYREIVKTDENGRKIRQRIVVKTKEAFIRQARKIWGDQYDYTESVYTDNKSPITIRCKKHDHYFTIAMAQNHVIKQHGKVRPTGCDLCMAEEIGYHPNNRGPHYFRTDEERQREREEKTRRREQRLLQAEQRKADDEESRLQRQREQQAYIKQWHAKDIHEARLIQRIHDKYGDQYDTALVNNRGQDKSITLICKKHGVFDITPRTLLSGGRGKEPHGCWKCCGMTDPADRRVITAKEFNRRVRGIYMLKPLTFPIKKKINLKSKVTATCARHGKITHDAQWWLDGKGCEYCNGKWYAPDWKEYARAVHGDKYEYVGNPPKSQNDYIHYICPKHGEIEQRYDVHVIQGCGCPKCGNYPNKKTPLERCQEWIAKCIEKYGEGRYDYSRAHEDYVNNDSLVWIRCCIHDHWFKQTPDNNLRTVNGSCPICSAEFTETQGEAAIRRWLLKHDIINFKQDEVTLPVENPRCKRQYLRPDFWLPDYNLFIEYNGEQHYEDIEYFFDNYYTFEDQQIRDETVRQYCRDHGHNLLEIPYWDFKRIDEILNNELLNINI